MEKQSPLTLVVLLIIALLAGLSGGYVWYWNSLADGLRDVLQIWLGQRRAEGFNAESGPVEIDGFPFTVKARIASLDLGRGSKGEAGYWHWRSRDISATLKPLKPLRVHVTTKAPLSVEFVDRNGTLRKLKAAARSSRGTIEIMTNGRLASADAEFQALALSGSALVGPVLAGRLKAHTDFRQGTTIDLQGDNLKLPAEIQPLFGDIVEVFRLHATINGKLPGAWSHARITAWRDDGGTVDITRSRIKWGSLDLIADGTLALDSEMRPLGSGTATIRGHNASIKSLANQGLITPLNAAALTIGLNMLGTENNGAIKVPVSAQNGRLNVGTISALRLKPLRFPPQ